MPTQPRFEVEFAEYGNQLIIMSWLTTLVREIVEPAALTILQWAWTFDPTNTPPALALPFRFYAYSATSVLLWLFELLPHWLLLSLPILGVVFVVVAIFLIFCYPAQLFYRILAFLFTTSLLLFRYTIVGFVRGVYWLCCKYDVGMRLCRRRPNRPRIEVCLPPAIVRPAILDRATTAVAPPSPIRAYPAVAPEGTIHSDSAPQLARNLRRRQPRSLRR